MCKRKDGRFLCDMIRVLDRWNEHFSELLNEGADGTISHDMCLYESDDRKELDPPSLDVVAATNSGLKNNMAHGLDGLTAELFKTRSDCESLDGREATRGVDGWSNMLNP